MDYYSQQIKRAKMTTFKQLIFIYYFKKKKVNYKFFKLFLVSSQKIIIISGLSFRERERERIIIRRRTVGRTVGVDVVF